MSPRLLFLLSAHGLGVSDWLDAQAAAARMPGQPPAVVVSHPAR